MAGEGDVSRRIPILYRSVGRLSWLYEPSRGVFLSPTLSSRKQSIPTPHEDGDAPWLIGLRQSGDPHPQTPLPFRQARGVVWSAGFSQVIGLSPGVYARAARRTRFRSANWTVSNLKPATGPGGTHESLELRPKEHQSLPSRITRPVPSPSSTSRRSIPARPGQPWPMSP
jgi:hypothetical protein